MLQKQNEIKIKETDLKKDFGSLKRKMSGQEFKDLVRKGSMLKR